MIQLNAQTEQHLKDLASECGQSVEQFLESLLQAHEEQKDIADAKLAMTEEGGISLEDLGKKYGL